MNLTKSLTLYGFIVLNFICCELKAHDDALQAVKNVGKTVFSVSLATATDKAAFYPIDNLIILRQSTGKGFPQLYKDVVQKNGIKGLYNSMFLQLAAVMPASVVLFGSYNLSKIYLKNQNISDAASQIVSGGIAGSALSLVTCPAEAERTRSAHGITLTREQLYNIRYIYKGFIPSLAKGIVYGSVALTGSDYLIRRFLGEYKEEIWAPFLSGTISGVISQVLVSPIDLLKTRVMADFTNKRIYQHIGEIIATRSYFDAMASRTLRYGPSAGIMIGLINVYSQLYDSIFDSVEALT